MNTPSVVSLDASTWDLFAISEITAGLKAHGRFLFSGTVELLEEFGFERVRQVGKHAWITTKHVAPARP